MDKTNRRIFSVFSFTAITFLLFFASTILNSSSVSAHELTVNTGNSIILDVTPNSTGVSIKAESINISSTCRNGYNLSISAPEGGDLYQYDSSNNTLSNTASFTAVDGVSALNNANNTNKWGYTLTNNASASTVFSPLSSTATTLKTPAQTASPNADINDTFSIYYGVKVDNSITPGNYRMANNGTIVYYATVEPTCLNYTVQYQDGGADNPGGMGTTNSSTGEKSVKQINLSEGTTITLLPPNFKKQGYSFLGWSTDENAYIHFTDNDNTNDPIIYGPMETVTIDSTLIAAANTRNQINMYPVWLPALRTDPSNQNSTPVYFQDWDNPNTQLPHDGCSTLTQTIFDDTETNEKDKIKVSKNSVVALTDKRDNEVYTVARLADGKCWMTENLRLEAEYTMGQNQNDSTVTNQYLSQGYGGATDTYGNFVGLAEAENTNFVDVTTANSVYKSSANPPVDIYNPLANTLEDIGTAASNSYRFPRYNNLNNSNALSSPTYTENYSNAASPSTSGTYKTSTVSSYGNYYTWAAAVANTNHYTSPSVSEAVGTSICPSGWHLPSSYDTTKEYSALSQGYGGNGTNQSGAGTGDIMNNRFRTFPNNFLYAGRFYKSDTNSRGSYGRYWSRSANGQVSSHDLYLYSTGLNPVESNHRYYGFSVRCLASATDVEITLDSNNGTNAVSRIYGTPDASITLPSSSEPSASIAQTGYGFNSWNTAPDGLGTSYTSSYTIPSGSTGETLYAQWTPRYNIIYVNNCMSWASEDANCSQTKSNTTSVQRINLDASGNGSGTLGAYNKFTITGWKIKEWTTNADGTGSTYPVNSAYPVTGASAGDNITLYAHWEPVYTVQYDGNGSDNDSTGMGSTNASTGLKGVRHTNVSEGDTFDLFASNFKREGHGFIGWSTDQNAWAKLTDNDSTNNAKIWGPNETIVAPPYNGEPIVTLYAVWAPAEKDGNNNPVYLQNWSGCSAMTAVTYDSVTGDLIIPNNSITALTDQRDNDVYAIAKLIDGNCWMIENLRLSTAGTVGDNINNNNVTNQSLSEGYGGDFIGLANPETANFTNTTTANSLYSSTLPSTRFPRYNEANKTWNDNAAAAVTPSQTQTVTSTDAHVAFNNYVYSYGNYYTWAAAVADTSAFTTNNQPVVGTSLCPSNWHMPEGGNKNNEGNSEYWSLIVSGINKGTTPLNYNSATSPYYTGNGEGKTVSKAVRSFPNNYLYSGSYHGSGMFNRGENGYYWSRTTASSDGYDISFNYNTVYVAGTDRKYYARSVRCLMSSQ